MRLRHAHESLKSCWRGLRKRPSSSKATIFFAVNISQESDSAESVAVFSHRARLARRQHWRTVCARSFTVKAAEGHCAYAARNNHLGASVVTRARGLRRGLDGLLLSLLQAACERRFESSPVGPRFHIYLPMEMRGRKTQASATASAQQLCSRKMNCSSELINVHSPS